MVERRALSPDPWPQVLVFPEGCQGNGTCLLRFNKVCLAAGVPIQPVAIRYRCIGSFPMVSNLFLGKLLLIKEISRLIDTLYKVSPQLV